MNNLATEAEEAADKGNIKLSGNSQVDSETQTDRYKVKNVKI